MHGLTLIKDLEIREQYSIIDIPEGANPSFQKFYN
jgi:hypothetical protein